MFVTSIVFLVLSIILPNNIITGVYGFLIVFQLLRLEKRYFGSKEKKEYWERE